VGLCIRPFGLLIAGDQDCHDRHDQIKADKLAHGEQMAWARNSGDGKTPLEGIFETLSPFGFLETVVKNDPLSKLLGGLGAPKDPATGAVDPTPFLLIGGVAVVGAIILLTHKGKK
jgi:hypothetical protein